MQTLKTKFLCRRISDCNIMPLYFSFSDESGSYEEIKTRKFLHQHPYYIRSSFLIQGSEWKTLNDNFIRLKNHYDIPLKLEIKWQDLWFCEISKRDQRKVISEKDVFLQSYDYNKLVNFVVDCLELPEILNFYKVVITVTKNDVCSNLNKIHINKWHLQNHMQRIELELQNDDDNLCLMFFDSISSKDDKFLLESYNQLYSEGDFIQSYGHIKDSLNIVLSHHSVGIQIADLISGAFNGCLRGFDTSKQIFYEKIRPYLRTHPDGDRIFGYGIMEIPTDNGVRTFFKSTLSIE